MFIFVRGFKTNQQIKQVSWGTVQVLQSRSCASAHLPTHFFLAHKLSNSGLTCVSPAYYAHTPQLYSWHPDLFYQTLPFSPAPFHQGQALANTCQYPNGFFPLWRAGCTQGTQITAQLLLSCSLCKDVSNQGQT